MAACILQVSERFKWRVDGSTQWEKGGGGDGGVDGWEGGEGGAGEGDCESDGGRGVGDGDGRFVLLFEGWPGFRSLPDTIPDLVEISPGKFQVKFSVNFSQNPVHHPLALTLAHS